MPANFGAPMPGNQDEQAKEEEGLFAPGGKLDAAFNAPPPSVPNPPAADIPENPAFSAAMGKAMGKPPTGQQPPTAARAQLSFQVGKAMKPRSPDETAPTLQKTMTPSATPPKSPISLVPTPPSGSPKPVINLPKGAGSIPATATMFLFLGLAAVVLWRPALAPLLERGSSGKTVPITFPTSSGLSLLLFGVVLIFISELGPTEASFTALLMLGLWAVFLIMNPTVVQTFAGWVSQGNTQAATAKQSQTSHASTKGA